jgi:hypothetical protein
VVRLVGEEKKGWLGKSGNSGLNEDTVRAKLDKQGTMYAQAEAFRVCKFKPGKWADLLIQTVGSAEARMIRLGTNERAEEKPISRGWPGEKQFQTMDSTTSLRLKKDYQMGGIETLFHDNRPIAILVGAGVSIPAPSLLPSGKDFMRSILRRMTPEGVDMAKVMGLLERPSEGLSRPGEYLRFELMMARLQEIDPNLEILDFLAAAKEPNDNHFALAELIRKGCLVMTTNFDSLIERAFDCRRGSEESSLTVVASDADFPDSGLPPRARPTLWKLHGTVERQSSTNNLSTISTFTAAIRQQVSGRQEAFLHSVLQSW